MVKTFRMVAILHARFVTVSAPYLHVCNVISHEKTHIIIVKTITSVSTSQSLKMNIKNKKPSSISRTKHPLAETLNAFVVTRTQE